MRACLAFDCSSLLQGLLKNFTGIDDPYEVPEKPEMLIDTCERA